MARGACGARDRDVITAISTLGPDSGLAPAMDRHLRAKNRGEIGIGAMDKWIVLPGAPQAFW